MTAVQLPPHDDMVLNVLAFYADATPAERVEGFAWYPAAHAHAWGVGRAFGLPTEVVAAVIAVLSPQMEWYANLRWATEVIAAHKSGQRLPRRGLGNSLKRAAIALSGDLSDVHRETNTLKVRNFYGSILGERHSVTIDRHAFRVALGDAHTNPPTLSDGRYRAVAAAYRDAARELHKGSAGVQAVTWTVCKRLRAERTHPVVAS